jgi:4Fe-4S ferredoxin
VAKKVNALPVKLYKTEKEDTLQIEQKLYTKDYILILDKKRCIGCGVCEEVCPKEAVKTKKTQHAGKKSLEVDINEQKCIYCGICVVLCPTKALTLKIDGKPKVPTIENESIPKLIREIDIDVTRCQLAHTYGRELGCFECEKACPFGLITISDSNNGELHLDKERCVCCGLCETVCPYDLIRVRKIFYGIIRINHEKCIQGCHECLDVCPIKSPAGKAIYLSNDGKVHVNQSYCIYCGACKLVCPINDALDFRRTYINHTYVHSGTWNKIMEKLTSNRVLVKELRAKSFARVNDLVQHTYTKEHSKHGGRDDSEGSSEPEAKTHSF